MNFKKEFKDRIFEAYKEKGLLWLEDLPQIIQLLSKKWGFTFKAPLSEISYGFVAEVEYKGASAIFKATPESDVSHREIRWLQAHSLVCPQIYEFDFSENAFLMERLIPGGTLTDLVKAGKDDEATRVIAETAMKLQSMKAQVSGLTHLNEMKHIVLLKGHYDDAIVDKAWALYQDLTRPSDSDVVLHGDLHHDNILRHQNGWKVIDPHGYLGDKVFEISPLIYNPLDILPRTQNLEKIFHRRIDILAEITGFDKDHIRSWCFCMMMLSMAWTFEGTQQVPAFEARAAKILSSLV